MVKVYLKYMYGFLILVFMITGTDILNKMLPQESVTALEFAFTCGGQQSCRIGESAPALPCECCRQSEICRCLLLIENMPFIRILRASNWRITNPIIYG